MTAEPYVSEYLDEEEKELIEAIESDDYKVEPGDNTLSIEMLRDLQQAARNTINEATTKITIRLPRSDLARAKADALRE